MHCFFCEFIFTVIAVRPVNVKILHSVLKIIYEQHNAVCL